MDLLYFIIEHCPYVRIWTILLGSAVLFPSDSDHSVNTISAPGAAMFFCVCASLSSACVRWVCIWSMCFSVSYLTLCTDTLPYCTLSLGPNSTAFYSVVVFGLLSLLISWYCRALLWYDWGSLSFRCFQNLIAIFCIFMIIGYLPNSALHALFVVCRCTCNIYFTEFFMQGLNWMFFPFGEILIWICQWTPHLTVIEGNGLNYWF